MKNDAKKLLFWVLAGAGWFLFSALIHNPLVLVEGILITLGVVAFKSTDDEDDFEIHFIGWFLALVSGDIVFFIYQLCVHGIMGTW